MMLLLQGFWKQAMCRQYTWRANIRSSTVSFIVTRDTFTGWVCPILCTRSMACSSVVGFHQRSRRITWRAATIFRPRLPAFSDISITVTWRTNKLTNSLPKANFKQSQMIQIAQGLKLSNLWVSIEVFHSLVSWSKRHCPI